ncbi:MAG: lipopolysaccharide heptosyltransferase II [Sinobacteraceae bacterium]|nr:lipopolysaccharide heptosyltransferase II [Nevskiaceae bacterium]
MSADILVVGPSWVGDMVLAQALFMRLKQRFPESAIDVLAPGWSLPLLARMPEVRTGLALPFAHGEFGFFRRRALGRALRERRYARAIVLPNSWKSALVPYFARIPRRSGYARELRYGLLNDLRPLDRERLPTTVQQFLALAEDTMPAQAPEIVRPRLRTDPARTLERMRELALAPHSPAVALMPGAEYGPAKRWPLPYYAELADMLVARGFQVWVLGSVKEKALGEAIRRDRTSVHDLTGRTELVDVVDLLGAAQAAVTNDSGLMHVAAAVGTRVVALYGSSSPRMTPPLSDRARILYLGLPCSPCFARECPLGHFNCLRGIPPAQVLAALEG